MDIGWRSQCCELLIDFNELQIVGRQQIYVLKEINSVFIIAIIPFENICDVKQIVQ